MALELPRSFRAAAPVEDDHVKDDNAEHDHGAASARRAAQ
jgi:hypothetical protein